MLLEEFLVPLRLTQKELSKAIQVPYQRINEIINNKREITVRPIKPLVLH
ncbi:MAG: helix-turn-helix domain-containing protein [Thioploca sp.]|nr:helix-turn-helix domain-containing protein [Thioploca sp.]